MGLFGCLGVVWVIMCYVGLGVFVCVRVVSIKECGLHKNNIQCILV